MEKSIYSQHYRLFLDLLKASRINAGLTQQDLAAKLNTSQSFVSKCERGERRLDMVELRSWCTAIGIRFPEFVSEFDLTVDRNLEAQPSPRRPTRAPTS
jgi:transcriptional regulator with XRE-family HTH domain